MGHASPGRYSTRPPSENRVAIADAASEQGAHSISRYPRAYYSFWTVALVALRSFSRSRVPARSALRRRSPRARVLHGRWRGRVPGTGTREFDTRLLEYCSTRGTPMGGWTQVDYELKLTQTAPRSAVLG